MVNDKHATSKKGNVRASAANTHTDKGLGKSLHETLPVGYSTRSSEHFQEENVENRKKNITHQSGREELGDVFAIVKERVTVPECFTLYGYPPDSRGFTRCPFHSGGRERTPSLHMEPHRWRCFACQRGGTVIDAVMELFNLSPLDAVKQLNQDFRLGLELDGHRLTAAEVEAARTRAKTRSLSDAFQAWADGADRLLSRVVYIANAALEHGEPDAWTPQEAAAIKYKSEFESYLDILEADTNAENDEARLSLLRKWGEVRRNANFIIGGRD